MEAEAEATGFPIIGPAAGQACYLWARMTGARTVFEMGSGFGYSTAWFARAVAENGGGVVHHVVWDEQSSLKAREHLNAMGYGDLVRFHVGEAVALLEQTEGPFDLIFNDIDKEAYATSFEVIDRRLRSGGLLIVDNLLWDGRIFDPADTSAATLAVRSLTQRVSTHPGWISTVVPIRDGVLLAFKR
jgi:predicted O-methyltransferase YrrM